LPQIGEQRVYVSHRNTTMVTRFQSLLLLDRAVCADAASETIDGEPSRRQAADASAQSAVPTDADDGVVLRGPAGT
jgi:hypothetical protein